MTRSIDLVADLGEGYGSWSMTDDDALTMIVTSANVACGFHAGDPSIMRRTVELCVERGVAVGAHPGFQDLRGFGRRPVDLPMADLEADIVYQLGALEAFLRPHGARLRHVTPHGSLGNLAADREDYARAVVRATRAYDPGLTILFQESRITEAAREAGLDVGRVGFCDRHYNDDGSLVSRRSPRALLHDSAEIAQRAVRMAAESTVDSVDGKVLHLPCESLLIHGDSPVAVETAAAVREALESAGITVRGRLPRPADPGWTSDAGAPTAQPGNGR